ncbi:PDDEXK nuclease domain-containing protein [Segatella hominis]|nr:PDDEXK nuclease domain-containing protein [Segatella hominis]
MPNNFTRTINNPKEARRAVEMFKDEYLLDFINVEEIGEREKIDVDERVIEQSIVQNIKNFIMTFGRDFVFIGNQYHLEIYGVEQFPDLLFFNRELKATDFMPKYIGKLNFYCSAERFSQQPSFH